MLADQLQSRQRFASRQRRLFSVLVCPVCRSPLTEVDPEMVCDAVASGGLECGEHGIVGAVSDFRPGFLSRNLALLQAAGSAGHLWDLDLAEATTFGNWTSIPEGTRAESEADTFMFSCGSGGFELEFLGHDWGGYVLVEVADGERSVIDLYRDVPQRIVHSCGPLKHAVNRVSVSPLGVGANDSHGTQVVLQRVRRSVASDEVVPPGLTPLNRGNPYPPRFVELLAQQSADAMVLDCGGGDRRFGDDRVFNLEYMDYRLPDFYGDGLALPLADDSFDLILSQAVLEHMPDPLRASEELVRILKPGGLIYVEIAFMQPLHAVPSHYMNVTPHGISLLFESLEALEQGEFGGLSTTIEWIGDLVGAADKIGADRFASVLESLREVDEQMSTEELRMAASAVFLLGRKPLR